MHRYSHLFSTLHDEREPVSALGRGTHYSVLRAVIWPVGRDPHFHDFAVIWDEDHDDRVIFTVEQLYLRRHLPNVLAIGERKGNVFALTHAPSTPSFAKELESIAQSNPGDPFCSDVGTLDEPSGIISDRSERVSAYLAGIHALWQLGPVAIPSISLVG